MEKLQNDVGLGKLPAPLLAGVALFWCTLAAYCFLALSRRFGKSSQAHFQQLIPIFEWRFAMVRLTALTATFGAVIAFPFTIVRLALNRQDADTATQALFNDKIDTAVSGLHAQRQITKWAEPERPTGWEDDVTPPQRRD